MRGVGHPWFGRRLRARPAACKALPEFAELLLELFVLQIAQASLGHDHDVPASQQLEVVAEGFAYLAFEAVALDGQFDALLADHHAQAGMIEGVVTREQQDIPAGDLAGRGVEDRLELPGDQ